VFNLNQRLGHCLQSLVEVPGQIVDSASRPEVGFHINQPHPPTLQFHAFDSELDTGTRPTWMPWQREACG
jgi:hypothetical protein